MRTVFSSLLMLGTLITSACNQSDDVQELSGGYFYRSEGPDMHDILSHRPGGKEIPADVLGYDCDEKFIVAKQKPAATDEPLYEGTYNYPQGRDSIYYWLIIHSRHLILGPLTEDEFKRSVEKYNVPKNLDVSKAH